MRKMKFVNKETIRDFLEEESRLEEWGGRSVGHGRVVSDVAWRASKSLDKTFHWQTASTPPMVSAATTPISALEVAPRAEAALPMPPAPALAAATGTGAERWGSPPPDFSDVVNFDVNSLGNDAKSLKRRPQVPSLSTQSSLRLPSSEGTPMPLLVQLTPHEEVTFEQTSGGTELVARIGVKNISGRPIAYKVRR